VIKTTVAKFLLFENGKNSQFDFYNHMVFFSILDGAQEACMIATKILLQIHTEVIFHSILDHLDIPLTCLGLDI